MEIKFFQAECGDAAAIRYLGNDNKYHNIFIDSGYERTFRHALELEIQEIIKRDEKIDLWIVSHIHDDHIGGIIKYIDCVNYGEFNDVVVKYIYNPPRNYNFIESDKSASKIVSIDQGDILYEHLKSKNKLHDIDIIDIVEPIELAGFKLTFLSPNQKKLNKLRKKYSSTKFKTLEREEDESISVAVSQKGNDYNVLLKDFNLDNWSEDSSIENGSSISLLTEFENKKILWLADSHPTVIVKSLKKLGYNNDNKLKCEWVKVTHHGSKGNNNDELFNIIDSSNYLFSVNGENKHNLPSKECIARILRNEKRSITSIYNFYFTYDNEVLRSIFKIEDETVYDDYRFQVFYNDEKAVNILFNG
jgi:beta-lactamase superfamily II metal-dependent hydrolase